MAIPDQYGELPLEKGAFQKQIRLRQPPKIKPGFPIERWKPITSRKHNSSLELLNGHWTTHDLRRTAATIMQELGVMPHIIKKCLNQRMSDPIMETYQRAELKAEQKEAFIKLGNYLANILYGSTIEIGNYITLKTDEYITA
jgi:integrase